MRHCRAATIRRGCDARRCGDFARLLAAAFILSVDLVHSNQLNFMLLTIIYQLNFSSLYLRRGDPRSVCRRRRRSFPWSVAAAASTTTTPRSCRYDS